MKLDLTEEETDALARLLRRTIDEDRYPLSPRIQTLKAEVLILTPRFEMELGRRGVTANAVAPGCTSSRREFGIRASAPW